jgi:hypothetical protein
MSALGQKRTVRFAPKAGHTSFVNQKACRARQYPERREPFQGKRFGGSAGTYSAGRSGMRYLPAKYGRIRAFRGFAVGEVS